MPNNDTPSPDEITASFERLAVAAMRLNAVSDKHGQQVSAIEAVFQGLNIGVQCWVDFANYRSANGVIEDRSVGYAKVGPKWGLAIRIDEYPEHDPEASDPELWPYREAPRTLRLQAFEKVPQLIDKLVTETNTLADKIKAQIPQVQLVAETLTAASKARKPKGGAITAARAADLIAGSMHHSGAIAQAEALEGMIKVADNPGMRAAMENVAVALDNSALKAAIENAAGIANNPAIKAAMDNAAGIASNPGLRAAMDKAILSVTGKK